MFKPFLVNSRTLSKYMKIFLIHPCLITSKCYYDTLSSTSTMPNPPAYLLSVKQIVLSCQKSIRSHHIYTSEICTWLLASIELHGLLRYLFLVQTPGILYLWFLRRLARLSTRSINILYTQIYTILNFRATLQSCSNMGISQCNK